MGAEVCRALVGDPSMELVAAVDPRAAGAALSDVAAVPGPEVSGTLSQLTEAGAEIAVDFTEAGAVLETMRWCASRGIHGVVGTTGLGDSDLAELMALFTPEGPNCVVASNFAIGAVILAHLAAIAAPYMDSAEVVELHHDGKRDAPSGTSLQIASAMAEAREASRSGPWAPDATTERVLAGARGGEGPGGTPIHSVRLRGLVAHHEVLLGAQGQSLTLRHDSYDRGSFMPGVLLAVKKVASRPGLTVGLGQLIGL